MNFLGAQKKSIKRNTEIRKDGGKEQQTEKKEYSQAWAKEH